MIWYFFDRAHRVARQDKLRGFAEGAVLLAVFVAYWPLILPFAVSEPEELVDTLRDLWNWNVPWNRST